MSDSPNNNTQKNAFIKHKVLTTNIVKAENLLIKDKVSTTIVLQAVDWNISRIWKRINSFPNDEVTKFE